MNVPFANLKRQHDVFKKQLVELFERHIDESNFVRGQEIIEFENEFSEAHRLTCGVLCEWNGCNFYCGNGFGYSPWG